MALKNINEIGANKPLNPQAEQERLLYIAKNRRLYNANTQGLQIDAVDKTIPAIMLNWFRRVATFYPEFLMSTLPTITIEGNSRMVDAFDEHQDAIMAVLLRANVDMLRYGLGVIASNPLDPTQFMQYERDQHYEVVDQAGRITADILVSEDKTNELFNFIIYPVAGGARWVQYTAAAGLPGAQVGEIEIPDREGRQVILLEPNPAHTSIFDDMIAPMAQMSRVRSGLARTLKRNFNPHLYGSSSMLVIDDKGNAELNPEGMFFPVDGDDTKPGYLQWDSNVEAAKWDYATNQEAVFTLSGLTPLLFDPSIQTGVLSGEALRRSLAPFLARLGVYARVNTRAIKSMIALWNLNRKIVGKEVFAYENTDITVDWHYEAALGLNMDGQDSTDDENDNPTE